MKIQICRNDISGIDVGNDKARMKRHITGRSATAADKARQAIPVGFKKSSQENKFLAHSNTGRVAPAADKARQVIPVGFRKSLQENKFLAHSNTGDS